MTGRTSLPPTIPFPLLFMMFIKRGNLWNHNHIIVLGNVFTLHYHTQDARLRTCIAVNRKKHKYTKEDEDIYIAVI